MINRKQIEVTAIATGHVMYASLLDPTKKELADFVKFYRGMAENGRKKYRVKVLK